MTPGSALADAITYLIIVAAVVAVWAAVRTPR